MKVGFPLDLLVLKTYLLLTATNFRTVNYKKKCCISNVSFKNVLVM